ncbi:efflux RND transporter periplasmic adaptor subunit [Stenotrophomonas sp. C3(2023)]|uniref:efflux RND transporter periplasmic adaptor subunit n=1 Tax=Stenotrophomonas sp. C3(2023) TaxID=3080277 RepID=UPI00293CF693|nr:efflux RND transporter periplasmic adaptor subunit [Stenotrophomonas sp. C3(2023)]MDV3469929.1 efflux RND transporter periplasmic adaptor subunit [Stenotrophomonas sp. C3(2023)]
MSRLWKIVLLVLAAVVLVIVGARVLGGGKGGAPAAAQAGKDGTAGSDAAPVPVTVVEAARQDVPVYASALGTVSAMNTVTVSPQVGGQLLSLDFKEGQKVNQGDVLARIDPRSAQASYDEAAAAKRQNLALLATARSNYQRSNSPEYRQYVAQTDLVTQRNQVSQYESAVAANEASMRAAQVQLQYTRITAPITGVAGLRAVDAGNVVSAGTALVTLTQMQPIHVIFSLPERQLGDVRQAQAAGTVAVAARDSVDAHVISGDGTLDVVDNLISSDSGTFRARAVFGNADNALWPGQFVNVRMQLRTIAGGVVVPSQAVLRGPEGEYVYVVQGDQTVKMQTVRSGVEVGDSHVQIAEGLKGGEQVVSEGQFRLKPGSKVTALKPGEAPAEPTEAELKAAQQGGKRRGQGGGPR